MNKVYGEVGIRDQGSGIRKWNRNRNSNWGTLGNNEIFLHEV